MLAPAAVPASPPKSSLSHRSLTSWCCCPQLLHPVDRQPVHPATDGALLALALAVALLRPGGSDWELVPAVALCSIRQACVGVGPVGGRKRHSQHGCPGLSPGSYLTNVRSSPCALPATAPEVQPAPGAQQQGACATGDGQGATVVKGSQPMPRGGLTLGFAGWRGQPGGSPGSCGSDNLALQR